MQLFSRKSNTPQPNEDISQLPSSFPADSFVLRKATVIENSIELNGSMKGGGSVQIDGKFEGEIQIEGDLTISEAAIVTASISASTITVSGQVRGNITAKRLHITDTGKVWGDLTVSSLLIAEGALHEGHSKMKKEGDDVLPEGR